MTAPTVTLVDLVDLFAGVPDENGDWSTTPAYSIPLAVEICRRTDPTTVEALRRTLYGDIPTDMLDTDALETLKLAHDRYRQSRGNRGL